MLYSLYDGTNGNYTKIDHGYGLATAYCHNDNVYVSASGGVDRAPERAHAI